MTVPPQSGSLRPGWTTGACATAAARAAYAALLGGAFPDPVGIVLPGGKTPSFALSRRLRDGDSATAGVIKDAGDDPDITHGAEIVATVTLLPPGSGLRFAAGDGVGTVTLPGLPLAVGEPAINPGPRAQMANNLLAEAQAHGLNAVDALITVAIPGGAALAGKTLNPRLGILGGLSILGTTGVVIPYSCAAWVHSIQRGVDVARAAGLDHLAGATGRTSESVVRSVHGLPELALIDMGDFAGALLKYLRRHPVRRLTLGGGFAKLSKLAAGEMDLHSGRSQVDVARLAALVGRLGGDADAARACVSGAQVLALAEAAGLPLAATVAAQAHAAARAVLAGETAVDVVMIDRAGRILARVGAQDDT